jgi:dihydropteroate synthase
MAPVRIVGVLNLTPDSYHDGGKLLRVEDAVRRAGEMLAEGADILELGGESTGPRSPDVTPEEERERVLPALRAIRSTYPEALLSVDTYKAPIAAAALAEGASMINDVTAGRGDPEMFAALARSDASLVLMFSKDPTARTTVAMTPYTDVVADVSAFLAARRDAAVAAGISAGRIILDPGMGHFVSSDARYSLELIARLQELQTLCCPLFLSASRKSFLSGAENLPAADRLPGTVAASAIAVLHGASYIRTHDVREVRRGCEIAGEIRKYMR